MKATFIVFTVIAYLIATFMLLGAAAEQSIPYFIASLAAAAWGTASLVGCLVTPKKK